MNGRLRRSTAGSPGLDTLDGFEVGGEGPGRTRIAGIMLLQEQIKGDPEAALGKTAGAAMTTRAIVRKHPGCRFAFVDILRMDGFAGQPGNGAQGENEREHMPPRSPARRDLGHYRDPVILRHDRADPVMLPPCERT